MCNPAMMGIILLGGTVVNNAILLLDFILKARASGLEKDEAIVQAVRLRFRPILMTAASTALGLTPLVFELAVGMERMSPLGIVAAFGLTMGIFSSTWIYPVIYSLFDSAATFFKGGSAMKKTAITLCIFALFAIPTHAQEATNQTMTLEQAVEYAQRHSPFLQVSQADVLAMRGSATSARAGLLPQINLVGDVLYGQNKNPIRMGASPMEIRFANTTYSVRVEASQLLFDFGKTWSRMEAARGRAEASTRMEERLKKEITFRVTALYHQRLMIDDLIAASRATEKSLHQLSKNIQAKLEAGKAVRLDQLKVQVKLADVQSTLSALDAQRVNTEGELLSTMGYQGTAPQWLPPTDASIEFAPKTPEMVWLEKAWSQRLDLMARRREVEAGQAEEKSARRSRWPTLSGFAGYGQYGGHDPEPGNAWGNQEDGWEENYYFGARISLPLFDSGLRSGQILAAQAQRMKAEAMQAELLLRIEREVRSAIAELRSADARVATFKESVKVAQLALADEQKKHDAGKSTINDLLDAEAAKLAADSQYSKALHEQQIARVNLRLAIGDPLGVK
jgi:outer membrane protein TolC